MVSLGRVKWDMPWIPVRLMDRPRIKDILRDYGQISKRALDHAERYDWRNISAEYARLYSDFG